MSTFYDCENCCKIVDLIKLNLTVWNISAEQVYGDILDDKLFRAMVYPDGSVSYFTAGRTTTSCILDMTFFPFDVQACYIHVDSWTYTAVKVHLVNITQQLNTRFYRQNGQWALMRTEVVCVDELFEGLYILAYLMAVSYCYVCFCS